MKEDYEAEVERHYNQVREAHQKGTLQKGNPTLNQEQLSMVYSKITTLMEENQTPYQKEVQYWTRAAISSGSISMSDYCDNEVRVAHRGTSQAERKYEAIRTRLHELYD